MRSLRSDGVEAGLAQMRLGTRPWPQPVRLLDSSADACPRDRPSALPTSRMALLRAVADDRGGDAGALAAIVVVDILDHLLAPLMLEIDVDVGRLAPFGRDEALEQQVDPRRIDRGDAEHEADGGIGGRAAALAEDAARARECDDVPDGEEIGRVIAVPR